MEYLCINLICIGMMWIGGFIFLKSKTIVNKIFGLTTLLIPFLTLLIKILEELDRLN